MIKKELSVEDSIRDILLTPLGSRVMRPEYGSRLHLLMDRKVDDHFLIDLSRFVFDACLRWENRVVPQRVTYLGNSEGKLNINIEFKNWGTMTL